MATEKEFVNKITYVYKIWWEEYHKTLTTLAEFVGEDQSLISAWLDNNVLPETSQQRDEITAKFDRALNHLRSLPPQE